MIEFSEELARKLAGDHLFKKGETYFRAGQVIKIWREDNEFKAIVQGTHRYTVPLSF